jgi:putative DNA primase/helicase
LLITEGEKKAAKADQEGLPCIGLVGVYGWQKKRKQGPRGKAEGARELIDGLAPVRWGGRQVYVCFDSDAAENKNVQRAEWYLAQALQAKGAIVRVVRLPPGPPDADGKPTKVGLDDFLVAHGLEAFRALLAQAQPPSRPIFHVIEADDDPHRLAEMVLSQTATAQGRVWRYWRAEWHRWDGGAYRRTEEKELRAVVARRVQEEFARLNLVAQESGTKTKGRLEALQVTTNLVANVLLALQGLCLVPGDVEQPAWLDAAQDNPPFPAIEVLACKNQLVHLSGLVAGNVDACFRPPTPLFFNSVALDYDFDLHAPPPGRWLTFLGQIWPEDPEAITALQEMAGYLLTPDTRHHKIGLLIGPPRAGKGVIVRVLTRLIGKANVASPSLADLSSRFGLWGLLGKSLAVIPDARMTGKTDQGTILERLLNVSGEDDVMVDRKNLPPLVTRLGCRFLIVTNELPQFRDDSGAILERLLVLRLTKSFTGKEDPELTSKLVEDLPGILCWAIEGWARLNQPGGRFTLPPSARELLDDFREVATPVRTFVAECCFLADNATVSRADLFGAWQEWCRRRNKQAGDQGTFGKNLRAAHPHLRDSQPREGGEKVRKYVGISLGPTGHEHLLAHKTAAERKSSW